MDRGFTFVELLLFLVLLSLGAASFLPALRHQRDRLAVAGAREAVAGVIARGRAEARARGGAAVVLRASPPGAWVEGRDGDVAVLGSDLVSFGVQLELGGEAEEVRLRYDALGVGRVASRTVVFRRGRAEAALVVASYGRVSRR